MQPEITHEKQPPNHEPPSLEYSLEWLKTQGECAQVVLGLIRTLKTQREHLINHAISNIQISCIAESNIVAMQSACIEAETSKDAKRGLFWIWNTLRGPGNDDDVFESIETGKTAQQFFDENAPEYITLDKATAKIKSELEKIK